MAWPRTFKSRILLLIAVLLPAASIVVRLIAGQPVYESMYESTMRSSANALRLMEGDIQNGYNNLQYVRRSIMETRRQQLKDHVASLIRAFQSFERKVRAGRLSEPEAQRSVLDYAESVRFEPEGYFFIYDEDSKCIGHIDPRFIGRSLSDFRDANGQYVLRDLMIASKQT